MNKDDLIYWGKRTYDKGLSPAVSGNISCIDDDNNILITSTGTCAGDLTYDNISKINFKGELLDNGGKPSSEKNMHIKIYEKRPDIKAIIHSHSPEITAFAAAGMEINEVIMPEFAYYFGSIPLSKYFLPSSNELAEHISNMLTDKNAVLMRNHGIVVAGENLKQAFYSLESIQAYCSVYLNVKILGKIKTLTKKQIKEIEKLKK